MSADRVTLRSYGENTKAATRTILTGLRRRGWQDRGAALAVVRRLDGTDRPVSIRTLVKAVPGDFFVANRISRGDLEAFLRSELDAASHHR